MEDWQKDIIDSMFEKLISQTTCNDVFLSKFRKIISDDEYNRLTRLPYQAFLGETTQNSEFYKIIRTRLGAFSQLYLALQETHQTGLANLLLELTRKKYPEKYNNLVNDDSQVEQLGAASSSVNSDGNLLSSCVSPAAVDGDIRGGKPYEFSVDGKKFILPINIVDFNNEGLHRNNSKIDMENIKRVFPKLGYEVFPKDIDKKLRYSRKDILDKIRDFKEACRLFQAESCILFIGSHGKEDKIYSSDGDFVRVNKHIVQEFYHEKFPYMKGKPKIIIIQACRNFDDSDAFFELSDNNDEDSSTEAERREENDQIKEGAITDTVIIHSQVPGLPSTRNGRFGSWLVHYITEVFEEKAANTSVMNMLREVRDKVNKHNRNPVGQIPEIRDLGYKDFQLNA